MELSKITETDYLNWLLRRALRRESVDKAVEIARWVVVTIITVLLTASIVFWVNTCLFIEQAKITLSKSVQDIKSAAGASSNAENPPSLDQIKNAKFFGSIGPKIQQTSTPIKTQTKLPLVLIGTFLEDKDRPYTIIEDDKKKVQDVFNIGDMVFGDAKVVNIFSDKVEIHRNGQIEYLTLDDGPSSPTANDANPNVTEFAVDGAELDTALKNLPSLLTQARAVPYFKDGKAIGLRMFSITSGSLYEKVGLQNGDILKNINGNSLSDISQAMRLFETLKQDKSINVTLERNREEKEFHYQIK